LRDKIVVVYLNAIKMSADDMRIKDMSSSAWYVAVHLGRGVMST